MSADGGTPDEAYAWMVDHWDALRAAVPDGLDEGDWSWDLVRGDGVDDLLAEVSATAETSGRGRFAPDDLAVAAAFAVFAPHGLSAPPRALWEGVLAYRDDIRRRWDRKDMPAVDASPGWVFVAHWGVGGGTRDAALDEVDRVWQARWPAAEYHLRARITMSFRTLERELHKNWIYRQDRFHTQDQRDEVWPAELLAPLSAGTDSWLQPVVDEALTRLIDGTCDCGLDRDGVAIETEAGRRQRQRCEAEHDAAAWDLARHRLHEWPRAALRGALGPTQLNSLPNGVFARAFDAAWNATRWPAAVANRGRFGGSVRCAKWLEPHTGKLIDLYRFDHDGRPFAEETHDRREQKQAVYYDSFDSATFDACPRSLGQRGTATRTPAMWRERDGETSAATPCPRLIGSCGCPPSGAKAVSRTMLVRRHVLSDTAWAGRVDTQAMNDPVGQAQPSVRHMPTTPTDNTADPAALAADAADAEENRKRLVRALRKLRRRGLHDHDIPDDMSTDDMQSLLEDHPELIGALEDDDPGDDLDDLHDPGDGPT